MKFYSIRIPFAAVDEVQDGSSSMYEFLLNYGSNAYSRQIEGEWDGEDQKDGFLEIMSFNRDDIECIEPGVVRGVNRFFDNEDFKFDILEFVL